MKELKKLRFQLVLTYLASLFIFLLFIIGSYGIPFKSLKIVLISPITTLITGFYGTGDFNPTHIPNFFILVFSLITFFFITYSIIKVRNTAINIIAHIFLALYWIIGFTVIGIAV